MLGQMQQATKETHMRTMNVACTMSSGLYRGNQIEWKASKLIHLIRREVLKVNSLMPEACKLEH